VSCLICALHQRITVWGVHSKRISWFSDFRAVCYALENNQRFIALW